MPSSIRITGARITPVAFRDPPLLNTVGIHQPYALRAIVQLDTDAGLVGLGETYADSRHLTRLQAAAELRYQRRRRPSRSDGQRPPFGTLLYAQRRRRYFHH